MYHTDINWKEVIILDRSLTVLLVEDDAFECSAIENYAQTVDDIRLIATTNSSHEAIEYVKDRLPEAVILDLELHEGGGNGIQFLQSLRDLKPQPYPYILVTTNNLSVITHERIRKLGADFIMAKSQFDYGPHTSIEFLREIRETIQAHQVKKDSKEGASAVSPEQKRRKVESRINAEFDRIGIGPSKRGRKYLADAVFLIYSGIRQDIYTIISQKYNVTNGSVERAMQTAINAAWRDTDVVTLQTCYTARINSTKGNPTITEFIYYYADMLIREY